MPEFHFPGCEIRGYVPDYANGCFRRYRVYLAGWNPERNPGFAKRGYDIRRVIGRRDDAETELIIQGIWPSRIVGVVAEQGLALVA